MIEPDVKIEKQQITSGKDLTEAIICSMRWSKSMSDKGPPAVKSAHLTLSTHDATFLLD